MKVLFFCHGIGYGGASKMINNVSKALCDENQVQVLVFRNYEDDQIFDERVKIIFNRLYQNPIRIIEIIGQIYKLHKYIKNNNIDIVVSFLHPANFMSVLAVKGTKAKVLLSERGDPITRVRNGNMYVKFVEKILHCADAYVFQTKEAMSAYPIKCQQKGKVIINAIPKRNYPSYSPSKNKYVLYVGRMEIRQKRQDVLIRAFRMFYEKHRDYRLLFVGDGPDIDIIKNEIILNGIEGVVDLLGKRHDVLEIMSKASFLVLSSDYEGVPNVLLEALAVGTPCITTDYSPGSVSQIVKDGINGYVVPKNDPTSLAKKMDEMANNDMLRVCFSKESLSYSSKFNQDEIFNQWVQLIDTLNPNSDN